ncbi:hypothetical protein LAV79_06440 [Peribacillus butanolivorans]|uniref:hypothetical protein n=1 Tax=Peribacillus butanolivorans TaxID=421767 RepID=UPI0030C9D771
MNLQKLIQELQGLSQVIADVEIGKQVGEIYYKVKGFKRFEEFDEDFIDTS